VRTCQENFGSVKDRLGSGLVFYWSAEAVILEPTFHHGCGIKEIPAIDDHRSQHQVGDALPVKLSKLFPFGENQQGIDILSCFVRIAAVVDLWKNRGSLVHGLLVVSAHLCSFGQQSANDFEGGREADIVGIGLPFITQSALRIFSRSRSTRRLLTRSASFNMVKSTPQRSANRIKAWISLGRQKPPKPSPASRNRGPMRGSKPIARVTSLMSAPTFSHKSAIMLA
jgi:hypothetical protein